MSERALLVDLGDWSKQQAGHWVGLDGSGRLPGNSLGDFGVF